MLVNLINFFNGINDFAIMQIFLFALSGRNPYDCIPGTGWICGKNVFVTFSIVSLFRPAFYVVGLFPFAFYVVGLSIPTFSIDALLIPLGDSLPSSLLD
jgi:hypothetical protein